MKKINLISILFAITLAQFACDNKSDRSTALVKTNCTKSDEIIIKPHNLVQYYPNETDDPIIRHDFYHLSYNEGHEQPNWVIYKLTKQMLTNPSVERSNNFREDSIILTGSASKKDYLNSGYDRGHLVPAADMNFSEEAMSETFYLSNMSPQIPDFNRGIWSKLERKVRKWVLQEDSLIVIVGSVNDSCITWIGADSVCVPFQYFKIVLDISPPYYKSIAFIMKNELSHKSLFNFSTTIDSVERITGIDFFANVEMLNIDSIESTKNDTLWR